MFGFHKTLDVITLFSKAGAPASLKVHTLLKQASARASSYATEDQASNHGTTPHKRGDFELDVTEEPPTEDQFKSILGYLGGSSSAGKLFTGARNEAEGLKQLKSNPQGISRPIVVDWSNGRAVVGDNESQILKLLNEKPKE